MKRIQTLQQAFLFVFANCHLIVDYWNLEEPREPDLYGIYHYDTKEHGSFAVLSMSVLWSPGTSRVVT